MNVSGNFSDFMSSDEERESQKSGAGSALLRGGKGSRAGSSRRRKPLSSNPSRLPEIEENKSI